MGVGVWRRKWGINLVWHEGDLEILSVVLVSEINYWCLTTNAVY